MWSNQYYRCTLWTVCMNRSKPISYIIWTEERIDIDFNILWLAGLLFKTTNCFYEMNKHLAFLSIVIMQKHSFSINLLVQWVYFICHIWLWFLMKIFISINRMQNWVFFCFRCKSLFHWFTSIHYFISLCNLSEIYMYPNLYLKFLFVK